MLNLIVSISKAVLLEYLPISLILMILASHRRSIKPLYAMLFLAAAVSLSTTLLLLPRFFFFTDLGWNWQGKLLDFTWPWFVVYGMGWLTPDEVGLRLPEKKDNFTLAVYLAFMLVLLGLVVSFLVGEPSALPLNTETLLFQLTMPGLAEEITSRGILLAILNRYLGKPWKIGSVSFGWGIILVTIMFVIEHTYHYDITTHVLEWTITSYMDYVTILMVALAGIVFGYIREKSGSIWPGVLLHNIVNSFGIIAGHLLWAML